MKRRDHVAEIARLFHTTPSALRYWEDAGLVHFDRDEQNQYRVPTYQTFMELCEVLFYRSISLPLKDILRLRSMDAPALEGVLASGQEQLEEQILKLQASVEKIQAMKSTLDHLKEIKSQGFTLEVCRLPEILPFSFQDPAAVSTYIHDSYNSILYLRGGDLPAQYGLLQSPGSGTQQPSLAAPLRPSDSRDTQYLRGLLEVDSSDSAPLNTHIFQEEACRLGYRPGAFMGRYLASFCPEAGAPRRDYYDTWMEIALKKTSSPPDE